MTSTAKPASKTRTTRTRRTSTAKTNTPTKPRAPRKTATAKSTATAKKATPVVVEAPKPVLTGPTMRKKELIEAVVAQSGVKKRDVKPALEAALQILADALRDGRELNLPPLGKIMVRREKKLQDGTVLMTKMRLKDQKPDNEAEVKAAAE